MRLLITGLLLLAAACRAPSVEQPQIDCRLSIAFADYLVRRAPDRRHVFTIQNAMDDRLAETILRDLPSDKDWPNKLLQYKPLVLKMAVLKGKSAVTLCDPLKDHLTARKIRFGKDVAKSETQRNRDKHMADIIDMSVAVVDAEHRYALVSANTVSGWLAGEGQVFYLRRTDDQNWKVIKVETLWVS